MNFIKNISNFKACDCCKQWILSYCLVAIVVGTIMIVFGGNGYWIIGGGLLALIGWIIMPHVPSLKGPKQIDPIDTLYVSDELSKKIDTLNARIAKQSTALLDKAEKEVRETIKEKYNGDHVHLNWNPKSKGFDVYSTEEEV